MIYFPKDWINIEKQAGVLIIGSGPAGLSLALKLEKLRIPSLIIEGGELSYTDESQEIYSGEVVSKHQLPYGLSGSRLRLLGGSSNCWAGRCGELDEEDFLSRDWINDAEWPIQKKDLNRYYDEAALFLDINRNKIINPENDGGLSSLAGFEGRCLHDAGNKSLMEPDFYINHLKKSNLISVYLNANCLKINSISSDNSVIDSITIRSYEDHKKIIRAQHVVLCCGGVENARILLNSSESGTPAIKNKYDLIGRYFSDHPIAPCATVICPTGKVLELNKFIKSTEKDIYPYYKIPFDIQKKLKISNSVIYFKNQGDELAESDVAAFKLYRFLKGDKDLEISGSDIMKIAKDPFGILKSYLQRRKSQNNSANNSRIAMQFQMEQTPNRESRVYLGDELDKFGQRKIKLNWVFNKIERQTLDLLMAYTADALQINRIGTLKMDEQIYDFSERLPLDLRSGQHHCGTTRMAANPRQGVVDNNLKLFEKKNLFVCGSSIFPTNSWVNPTFSIVAFSLRLADHISKKYI